MPKVLVLFSSRTGEIATVADAIAEGASSVRFTEVEVRRIEEAGAASEQRDESKATGAALGKKYRALESVESLAQYDALIIGSPVRQGAISEELRTVLDEAKAIGAHGALVDKVASVFTPPSVPDDAREAALVGLFAPLLQLGMILVPPLAGGGDALTIARQQGARVAKVAEWVRHAKSHEAHGHHH